MMKKLNVPTKRGTVLNGVLFEAQSADTVVIAITGIHGNFYSNPFYYNFGDTLNGGNIDFIYAQTNDALGKIDTVNVKTGEHGNASFDISFWITQTSPAISTSSWRGIPWGPTR